MQQEASAQACWERIVELDRKVGLGYAKKLGSRSVCSLNPPTRDRSKEKSKRMASNQSETKSEERNTSIHRPSPKGLFNAN